MKSLLSRRDAMTGLAGGVALLAAHAVLRAQTRTVSGCTAFVDAVNAIAPGFTAATGFPSRLSPPVRAS